MAVEVSACGHTLLQLFAPVQDDNEPSCISRGGEVLDEYEASAVGRDVEVPGDSFDSESLCFEQRDRRPVSEMRRRLYGHCRQPAVSVEIEQFATVSRPERARRPARRNLPAAAL